MDHDPLCYCSNNICRQLSDCQTMWQDRCDCQCDIIEQTRAEETMNCEAHGATFMDLGREEALQDVLEVIQDLSRGHMRSLAHPDVVSVVKYDELVRAIENLRGN